MDFRNAGDLKYDLTNNKRDSIYQQYKNVSTSIIHNEPFNGFRLKNGNDNHDHLKLVMIYQILTKSAC